MVKIFSLKRRLLQVEADKEKGKDKMTKEKEAEKDMYKVEPKAEGDVDTAAHAVLDMKLKSVGSYTE